jgi:predicted negative regulator of RcsB-dependent stress response
LVLKRKGSFVADQSEREQLDAMRAWWSENGNYVIGGIVVGIIVIFGINQWRTTTANREIAASTLYEDVMFGAASGDLDAAIASAEQLFADYNDTGYAAQARLALARGYMDNARDQDAADVLAGLIDTAGDKEVALIARLRLAKILLYQGKAEEVVGLIGNQPESAFSARYNEVLGDAYVEMEQFDEAQTAYLAALTDNPQAPTLDLTLIQLKINDLPEQSIGSGDDTVDAPAEPATADEAAADEMPMDEASAEPEAAPESGNE